MASPVHTQQRSTLPPALGDVRATTLGTDTSRDQSMALQQRALLQVNPENADHADAVKLIMGDPDRAERTLDKIRERRASLAVFYYKPSDEALKRNPAQAIIDAQNEAVMSGRIVPDMEIFVKEKYPQLNTLRRGEMVDAAVGSRKLPILNKEVAAVNFLAEESKCSPPANCAAIVFLVATPETRN